MLFVLKVIPVLISTNLSSDVREITTSTAFPWLSVPLTTFKSSISAIPLNLTVNLFSSEMLPAIPPTWKVRSVNCVPGSPMDCAATTPTASPRCTILPVAKLRP